LRHDFVEQVVQISMKAGAPVKLVWTREDDFHYDYYHPMRAHLASADLNAPGLPTLRNRSPNSQYVRTGDWRSVDNFSEAFARESFIDEMAYALDRDPVELRLELYDDERLKGVLELATAKAGWSGELSEGRAHGVAAYSAFNRTPAAQVAEVSVSSTGEVRVHRVVCAIDCGLVVNPDMIAAQLEGGIVWGLTAALKENISFENGQIQQHNFIEYPLLRYDEMPEVEVYFVESGADPTGVGEMGVPPAAPAILNAIFALTGKRIRHLPVRPEDLI
jgi:isoquinoline 1-oxidoreductase beta subunit